MYILTFAQAIVFDICVSLLNIAAIGFTFLRLAYRKRTTRLWWDDLTAACAGLCNIIYIIMFWMYGSAATEHSAIRTRLSPEAKYVLSIEACLIVPYLSRSSIALGIARVFPAGDPARRTAIGMAIMCGLVLVMLQCPIASTMHGTGPSNNPTAFNDVARFSFGTKIALIIFHALSDLLLVTIPIYKLWHVNLPRRQRRIILAGFAATALTTLVMLVEIIFVFAPASWEPAKSDIKVRLSNTEAGAALASCNLLVVITYYDNVRRRRLALGMSRSLQRPHPHESCDTRPTASPPPHSNQAPTTELISTLMLTDIFTAYSTGSQCSEVPPSMTAVSITNRAISTFTEV